jgi:hypothetical protein
MAAEQRPRPRPRPLGRSPLAGKVIVVCARRIYYEPDCELGDKSGDQVEVLLSSWRELDAWWKKHSPKYRTCSGPWPTPRKGIEVRKVWAHEVSIGGRLHPDALTRSDARGVRILAQGEDDEKRRLRALAEEKKLEIEAASIARDEGRSACPMHGWSCIGCELCGGSTTTW